MSLVCSIMLLPVTARIGPVSWRLSGWAGTTTSSSREGDASFASNPVLVRG